MNPKYIVVEYKNRLIFDGMRHEMIIQELMSKHKYEVSFHEKPNSSDDPIVLKIDNVSDLVCDKIHECVRDYLFPDGERQSKQFREAKEVEDEELKEKEFLHQKIRMEEELDISDIPAKILGSLTIGEVNSFINDLLGYQTDIYSKFVFIVDGKERGLTSLKFEDGIFHLEAKSLAQIEGEG